MPNHEEQYANFLSQYLEAENRDVTPAPGTRPTLPAEPVAAVDNQIITPKQPKMSLTIPDYQAHYASKKNYEVLELRDLPDGHYYYPGTKIEFRECDTREIEAYSMLDESSLYDFKEKIYELVQRCVRVTKPDGTPGTVADIKEIHKYWLVLLIREKTFLNGRTLEVPVEETDAQGNVIQHSIPVLRQNIEFFYTAPMMEYFDQDTRSFVFHTELQTEPIFVAPPTMGIKRCFDHYLRQQVEKGLQATDINQTFFKYAPFLLPHVSFLDYEELVELQTWFETTLTAEYFSFLDDLLSNHLLLGIRGLKKKVDDRDLRTSQIFPLRLRALFVLPDAFSVFLRKQPGAPQ